MKTTAGTVLKSFFCGLVTFVALYAALVSIFDPFFWHFYQMLFAWLLLMALTASSFVTGFVAKRRGWLNGLLLGVALPVLYFIGVLIVTGKPPMDWEDVVVVTILAAGHGVMGGFIWDMYFAPRRTSVSDTGGLGAGSDWPFTDWGIVTFVLLSVIVGWMHLAAPMIGHVLTDWQISQSPLTPLTFRFIALLWIFPFACAALTLDALRRQSISEVYRRRAVRCLVAAAILGVLFTEIAWQGYTPPFRFHDMSDGGIDVSLAPILILLSVSGVISVILLIAAMSRLRSRGFSWLTVTAGMLSVGYAVWIVAFVSGGLLHDA